MYNIVSRENNYGLYSSPSVTVSNILWFAVCCFVQVDSSFTLNVYILIIHFLDLVFSPLFV